MTISWRLHRCRPSGPPPKLALSMSSANTSDPSVPVVAAHPDASRINGYSRRRAGLMRRQGLADFPATSACSGA